MAQTIVRGKYVVCKITGPRSAEVVSGGAVFQRDGEIIEIGRYDDLRARHPTAEVIGSNNHAVLPGLVNDHYHVGLTPFQLGAPDLPLELWGLARLGARDVDPYLSHLYGAVQMIESGTTVVQIIHSSLRGRPPADMKTVEAVVRAYHEAGMRVSYALSVCDQNSLVAGGGGGEEEFTSTLPAALAQRFRSFMAPTYLPPEEFALRVEEICGKYAGDRHERVRTIIAPTTVHGCSDPLLVLLKQLAAKHSVGIHIHLQATPYQKLYALRTWRRTPLQHLYDLGFLGPDVTCGHSIWVTDEDIDLMAATGTVACHNPSGNLRLQGGIAPITRMLEKGIKVALGTDEAGINDDKDMLQEMRMALNLHRVPGIENTPPTAHQVFQMATENGADASGFGALVGALEPGKRADMVLLNLDNVEEPYLDPEVSILDAIVHRGRGVDVDTVIVDGEVIMKGRRLTRVDKPALFQELRRSLDRPLWPHEIERRELAKQVEPHLRRFYADTMGQISEPHYKYNAR